MYSDHVLWIIAQERQQRFLEEVEAERLVASLRPRKKERPVFWQRVSGEVGGLMVAAGQRLQTQHATKKL